MLTFAIRRRIKSKSVSQGGKEINTDKPNKLQDPEPTNKEFIFIQFTILLGKINNILRQNELTINYITRF